MLRILHIAFPGIAPAYDRPMQNENCKVQIEASLLAAE